MKKKLVFEVGVGNIHTSRTSKFWNDNSANFVLIEPNSFLHNDIKKCVNNFSHINLLNIAIDDTEGKKDLILASDRSFLSGKHSPMQSIFHNKYEKLMGGFKAPADCKLFSKIDTGDIDILVASIEGNEWGLLKEMISRPEIITFPDYSANDYAYVWPNHKNILSWLCENSYFLKKADYQHLTFYKQ